VRRMDVTTRDENDTDVDDVIAGLTSLALEPQLEKEKKLIILDLNGLLLFRVGCLAKRTELNDRVDNQLLSCDVYVNDCSLEGVCKGQGQGTRALCCVCEWCV
jgi:hypothetical protein